MADVLGRGVWRMGCRTAPGETWLVAVSSAGRNVAEAFVPAEKWEAAAEHLTALLDLLDPVPTIHIVS